MLEWELDDQRPIYSQLVEHIERGIAAGRWPPGEKMPGVRDLAAIAGVNPNTMQRAMAELETKGLLYAQRTSGRFVTEDVGKIAALRESLAMERTVRYVRDMNALGCTSQEITHYVEQVKEET